MNFEQEFHANFGERFQALQLKNIVARKDERNLVITFLYPSTTKELSQEEKNEIISFIKSKLSLSYLNVKVKFMRVFLEERLILKSIENFFIGKYKLVTSYMSKDNFKIQITPIDVIVDVYLSSRMQNYFVENKIVLELSKFLKDNFLADFVVNLHESEILENEDVDIENVELKTTFKPTQRFNVEIVKEIVGKNLVTKPEYISFIKSSKKSVYVAGFIKKIERREFTIKKGKREGQQKAYFNFQIQDEKGKLDCVFFCAKCYEKDMEALEEYMYVLAHGEVKPNMMGKLCLQVDKIALANKIENQVVEVKNKVENFKPVVEIEKLTALEQDNMFGVKKRYNKKIEEQTIVVFDIETTGFDNKTDQITELGAVKIEKGNIIEKFSTLVKPTIRIPTHITEITGIDDDMVAHAPPIEYVIKDFYDFTRGCVLCGHNLIDFDIHFIRREGDALGLKFNNELIDTMNEARIAKLRVSNLKLATIVKALGLYNEGAHRAWNDAYVTAQVLLKLNEI